MKTRIVAVLLAVMMVMAGTAMAGTLTDIVKRGELRVAVQSGAAPYAFVDKNGKHTGSMVDFAQDMADRMGVKLKILDFDWDGLIPALLSGKADMLAADMTPTLKRHLKITFCDPWYYVQPCVFMPIKIGNIRKQSLKDIWKNHPLLKKMRDRDRFRGCGKCEYRYICGGCRARAYGYYGDVAGPDPGCIVNKRYWDELNKGKGKK